VTFSVAPIHDAVIDGDLDEVMTLVQEDPGVMSLCFIDFFKLILMEEDMGQLYTLPPNMVGWK